MNRKMLEKLAKKHHLDLLGVVQLTEEPTYPHYIQWLKEKKHAGMEFLERPVHRDMRKDPRLLLPEANIAIILGLNYYQGVKQKLSVANTPSSTGDRPYVAQYARTPDYHKRIKSYCSSFIAELQSHSQTPLPTKITVDTAPILERALASQCSAGFIGKNTMFIHPQKGSFFLLGAILTRLPIQPDSKLPVDPTNRTAEGGCGSCRRCAVHCPTGALDNPYQLDARKCIAYYTIEHRGRIPMRFWKHLRSSIFGCDICQQVCPYNRGIEKIKADEIRLKSLPSLFEIATMDQKFYESTFGGTPLTRAKKSGLKRNALIALFVTNSPKLEEALKFNLSDKNPVVAGTIAQILFLKKKKIDLSTNRRT